MATKTINLDEGIPIAEEARKLTAEQEAEVKYAAESLLRTATKYGLVVAGFVFGHNPAFLLNVGSCQDCADSRLYEALCRIAAAKKAEGVVVHERVLPVN